MIYCRCSTEEEAQQDALQQQIIESREYVRQQGWLLVDEFIETKSGTTTQKRDEYNRLFEALQTDQFDIVQIKSQDRLMRNVKDWYLFVDRLVSNGKKLYIYMERKFYSADDALITGIKAILAEEFSKELSKKMNNAHEHRQADGRVFILPPNTCGLTKNEAGEFVPVEEEMKAIRVMFYLCRDMGCTSIAHYMEENGFRDRNGKTYSASAIRRILRNPIRCGTVVQNKRHFDFQTKKMVKVPEDQWMIHKNAVPAAVSEEEFLEANQALDRRAVHCKAKDLKPRGVNPGKYQLSGKICCGLCGAPYYRTSRRRYKDKKMIVEWKCQRYLEYGRKYKTKDTGNRVAEMSEAPGCENVHLDEERLYQMLEPVSRQYYQDTQADDPAVMEKVIAMIEDVISQSDSEAEFRKIQKEIDKCETLRRKLLDKLLNGVISDADYQMKNAELLDRKEGFKKKLEEMKNSQNAQLIVQQRLRTIRKRLDEDMQVSAANLVESIRKIEVFPTKLILTFQPEKVPGIQKKTQKGVRLEVPLEEEFFYAGRKEAQCRRILEYMRQDPHITAGKIARKEQVSVSAINARIRKLRKQGRIHFDGKGGHGEWVIREPDDQDADLK